MGLFWDLIQQSQISEQKAKNKDLHQRVSELEEELKKTKILLHKTLEVLEKHVGKDIDGNNKIG